jgi:hypothetical protein
MPFLMQRSEITISPVLNLKRKGYFCTVDSETFRRFSIKLQNNFGKMMGALDLPPADPVVLSVQRPSRHQHIFGKMASVPYDGCAK